MNRKSVKLPFIIRTVAALVVIFAAVVCISGYYSAVNYSDELFEDAEVLLSNLETDLKECQNAGKDSEEYRNGLNVAQANAVMRYYRFMNLKEFEYRDAEVDLVLYELTYNKNQEVVNYKEALPETLVMMAAPFKKYNCIIVFEDVCTDEQIQRVQEVVEKGDPVYISGAKGYKYGRFFYPVEMSVGNAEDNVIIESDYRDESQELITQDFQDIQFVLPGGRVLYGHASETTEPSQVRVQFEQEMVREGTNPGAGTNISIDYGYSEYQLRTSFDLASGKYAANLYIKAKPLKYAMTQLQDMYLVLFLVLLIVGWALISSHNRIIDAQMETESRRRRMMDSMAHEMKTPLGVIRNYGEVLLEEDDEETRTYFTQNIIDEADGLNQVVVSMLDLSKMEAGTYPMELSSLSVGKLAQKELERRRVMIHRNGLQLETDIDDTGRILADEKLVVNILSNFLSNAIGHTPDGGKLRVQIRHQGEEVYIGVYNQGQQLSPDEMEKVWNSFYRNRNLAREGSGLGLAIVRNACMMHRGSYGCVNEEDGVTFWARLRSMEDSQMKAKAATGPVLGVTGGGINLKGLLAVSAGYLIQGLLGGPLYWLTYLQMIFMDSTYDGSWWDCFSDTSNVMALVVGTVVMTWGIFQLFREKIICHPYKVVSLLAVWAAAILLCFCAAWKSGMPLDVDRQMAMTGVVLYGTVFALSIMMFAYCMNISRRFRNNRIRKVVQRQLIMYLILFAVWIIMIAQFHSYYAMIFGWPILSVYAVYTWLQTFRRFNGKEC